MGTLDFQIDFRIWQLFSDCLASFVSLESFESKERNFYFFFLDMFEFESLNNFQLKVPGFARQLIIAQNKDDSEVDYKKK